MTNFITHLQELYPLWQQSSLYPRFMLALLVLTPVIIACIGLGVINYRIAKRGGKKW